MLKVFAMKLAYWVTYNPSGLSNCLHLLIRTRMCEDTRKDYCPAHPVSPEEPHEIPPFSVYLGN